mgnify:CR=1 FL=1
MKKYMLSIGLNDKDSKRQEVGTLDAYKIVMNIFAATTGGATVHEGMGCYTHDNGDVVIEKSLIAYVYTDDDAAIRDAVMQIKTALNQEAIAVESMETNSMFI